MSLEFPPFIFLVIGSLLLPLFPKKIQPAAFLVFPLLALLQIAWYFRQAGVIARWLAFQQEPAPERPAALPWSREPTDYCPPLARGLRPEGS